MLIMLVIWLVGLILLSLEETWITIVGMSSIRKGSCGY